VTETRTRDTGNFLTVFGLNAPDQDVRRIAVEAVRSGYAVVPLPPGQKKPTICTLTARELKAADTEAREQGLRQHKCGVHHAITDDKVAARVFKRMVEIHGPGLGLGIVDYPSRIITVDADVATEVEAFQQHWADHEGGLIAPTVLTPGQVDRDGVWQHKNGGHFHFSVPAGVDLDLGHGCFKDPSGYVVKWGWFMSAVPPTVRKEGPYVARSNVCDAPQWLLDRIAESGARKAARQGEYLARYGSDGVAAWSVATSWESLLVEDGWAATGKHDSCGCPVFERPGGGSTTWKSATGHDNDCPQFENAEGHGFLRIWTDYPPEPLLGWVVDHGRTITKLRYAAVTRYGGDIQAARMGLGIDVSGVSEWWGDDRDDHSVTPASRHRDDRDDRDVTPSSPSSTVTGDDRDDPSDRHVTSRSSERDSDADRDDDEEDRDDVTVGDRELANTAVEVAMQRTRLPAADLDVVRERFTYRLIDRAVNLAVDIFQGVVQVGNSSWLPSPDFAEEFLTAGQDVSLDLLSRTDGPHLLARGRTNVLSGARGAGKTMLACYAAKQVLEAGGRVCYFDMEDRPGAFRERMDMMGLDLADAVREGRFMYLNPGPLPADLDDIIDYSGGFDLVVFDTMNRLISRKGGDISSGNTEIAWLFDNLFDPIAGRGPAVLILDHPNKKGQRKDADVADLDPGGGAMKMNTVSGHAIGMRPVKHFTRAEPDGDVRLITLKDRTGHYAQGAGVGEFRASMGIAASGGLGFEPRIDPPGPEEEEPTLADDLEAVKRRISKVLKEIGRPMSHSDLRKQITERKRSLFDVAVSDLLASGDIESDESGRKYSLKGDVT
jgi:hypothetical protein